MRRIGTVDYEGNVQTDGGWYKMFPAPESETEETICKLHCLQDYIQSIIMDLNETGYAGDRSYASDIVNMAFEVWPRFYKEPLERTLRKAQGYNTVQKTKHVEYRESAVNFWIFKKGSDHDEIRRVLAEENGVPVDGTYSHSPYDCTGRWYASTLWIRDFPKLTLAEQRWVLDV